MPLFLSKPKIEENPIEQIGEILLIVNKGEENISNEEKIFTNKLNMLNFETNNISEVSDFEFKRFREEVSKMRNEITEIGGT